MKVLTKPIEVVAWFDEDGIHPMRIRLKDGETIKVIKIEKVMYTYEEKLAERKMLVYRCRSRIGDDDSILEIKYDVSTLKWILFKM